MNTSKLWSKLKWLGILWMLWHCAGCDRTYLQYDKGMKDNIYMMGGDTLFYTFIDGQPEVEYNFPRYLKIMGMPKSYERTFRFEIIDSMTTAKDGIHYQFQDVYKFPKDSVYCIRHIKLIKNKDPELRKRPVTLAFRLVESDDFSVLPVEENCTRVYLTIAISTPEQPSYWFDDYLGNYTPAGGYRFMQFFHKVKDINPVLYERLTKSYGQGLEHAGSRFWFDNLIPMRKYVLIPLYEDYQKNPDPEVDMPDPNI